MSVQPGRTIYETSVSTERGATITSYSFPIGPVSQPATTTITQTLPGATYTTFLTAPGFNHSIVYTSFVTRPGSTFITTAPGALTTVTERETETLPGATFTAPGGSVTYTQYATKTVPGSAITSVVFQPGDNTTITSTKTTTCYETVSTCSASSTGAVQPPCETTIYATDYITKTIPTTYTADATCHDVSITVTSLSSGWDKPGGYGSHTSWDGKPSEYGGAATTSSGYWKRM